MIRLDKPLTDSQYFPSQKLQSTLHYLAMIQRLCGRGTVRYQDFNDVVVCVPFWRVKALQEYADQFTLISVRTKVKRLSVWEHLFLWKTRYIPNKKGGMT